MVITRFISFFIQSRYTLFVLLRIKNHMENISTAYHYITIHLNFFIHTYLLLQSALDILFKLFSKIKKNLKLLSLSRQ